MEVTFTMDQLLTPFVKQVLVASAPQLAGLSVGGVIGYPNVILEQFKANGSSIQVDFNVASWIGSTHGLAGIPSVFMPAIMQWRGRKPAFITCCLILIIGWFFTFFSTSATTILIAEAFHGLGANSIIIVSFFTISEMVDPKFRLISMSLYSISQTLGIAGAGILGRYMHWKTVGIIMSVPIFVALIIGLIWPESPSWLAFIGEFEKCQDSFIWLRGSDVRSSKELTVLVNSQKEEQRVNYRKGKLISKLKSKDFYVPCLQTFVCLFTFYSSGALPLVIYGMDIIRKITANEAAILYGTISIDAILFLGSFVNVFLLKLFPNKPLFLSSGFASCTCMACAALVSNLQHVKVLPEDSLLCFYFLIAFMICSSLGLTSMAFTVSAELMPVKHRDLGGSWYVILTCTLHFMTLKVTPYLLYYLDLRGTVSIFAICTLSCTLYIWRCVPETKNRTLQEIEYFYNNGRFVDSYTIDTHDNVNSVFLGGNDE